MLYIWQMSTAWPRPIGASLDYLGKRDDGCLLICDSRPITIYFYGTDLSPTDLQQHFTHASPNNPSKDIGGQSAHYTYDDWIIRYSDKNIRISYYDNTQIVVKDFALTPTNKKHIISINAKDYDDLKKAL